MDREITEQKSHYGFSALEKEEVWDRWQRGESLKAIGRAFGKASSSIYFQLSPCGGIRPAPRRRSKLALSLAEREEISRGLAAEQSARSLARLLGRAPSTVSREIRRNGGRTTTPNVHIVPLVIGHRHRKPSSRCQKDQP